MSSRLGSYDHLNAQPVGVKIEMRELVAQIEDNNYGAHRFLSELVRLRRRTDIDDCASCKMLTDAIEDALNKGGF